MLAVVHRPGTPDAPRLPGERLTRRALLGGSALMAAGLVAACTAAPAPGPTQAPTPDVDPDTEVTAALAADEAALIDLYDAVMTAHPALTPELATLRDEHVAHADAVGASPTASPSAPAVGSRAEALAALLAAEEQAVAQRTAACEAASATELARLAALIAASEAGHAQFLRGIA